MVQPLAYESRPSPPPQRLGRTNFGLCGFVAAAGWTLLFVVAALPLPRRFNDRLGDIVFDYGAIIILLILILCLLGLVQNRRNRRFALVGITLLGASVCLALF